jgi:hypothetical protein
MTVYFTEKLHMNPDAGAVVSISTRLLAAPVPP